MRITQLLRNTLLKIRRVGSTTACIEGLKSVGGGTLIVYSFDQANALKRSGDYPDIEFVPISNVNHFIGRKFDKPVLMDPAALVKLFEMIPEESLAVANRKAQLVKNIELNVLELGRL